MPQNTRMDATRRLTPLDRLLAGAQNALGTAVAAGMLTATGLGVYYTPLFFVLVTRLLSGRKFAGSRSVRTQ